MPLTTTLRRHGDQGDVWDCQWEKSKQISIRKWDLKRCSLTHTKANKNQHEYTIHSDRDIVHPSGPTCQKNE